MSDEPSTLTCALVGIGGAAAVYGVLHLLADKKNEKRFGALGFELQQTPQFEVLSAEGIVNQLKKRGWVVKEQDSLYPWGHVRYHAHYGNRHIDFFENIVWGSSPKGDVVLGWLDRYPVDAKKAANRILGDFNRAQRLDYVPPSYVTQED